MLSLQIETDKIYHRILRLFHLPTLTFALQFIQAVTQYNLFQDSFRLSGLVFHQHKALYSLTRKMSDFPQAILKLNKMILFCLVCMKMLNNTYKQFLADKVWKKRDGYPKRKNKGRKFSQLIIGNVLHYLILFLPIRTRFLYLFLQLSKLKMWPTIT